MVISMNRCQGGKEQSLKRIGGLKGRHEKDHQNEADSGLEKDKSNEILIWALLGINSQGPSKDRIRGKLDR